MSLQGKVALVTGASRGIGRAIVESLMDEGATVVGTATTAQGADDISAYIKQAGGYGVGMQLDVCDQEAVTRCLDAITEKFGTVTILVNNAGVTQDNLLMRMKDAEWDTVYETNLKAVYRISKACLRGMMKAREGRIINISSIVAKTGNPGQCNYATTKAGMIGFSKSLAREVASRGITVNVVAPGFIETDMTAALNEEQRKAMIDATPVGRMGDAKEVAHAVSFLASPLASFITGHTLDVNGGMHME